MRLLFDEISSRRSNLELPKNIKCDNYKSVMKTWFNASQTPTGVPLVFQGTRVYSSVTLQISEARHCSSMHPDAKVFFLMFST